jgi:hypothetical protein
LARFPYKEIFKDELALAAIERCAASAAFDLAVNGLWTGVGFDNLINRTAVRALERFCPEHGRPLPFGAAKSQFDYQT